MQPGDFQAVCAAAEIPNGGRRQVELAGGPILIFNVNRVFHAVRDRCTHLDYPLADGRQLGCEIICRMHGARFDLRSGRALGGPAVNPLQVYEVRVVAGMICVKLGGSCHASKERPPPSR